RGGRRVPRARAARVRRHDRARRDAAIERLPLGLLHAGRLPRPARDRRPALARRDGGAGRRQELSAHRGAAPALFLPLLARARHHLGGALHGRLSDGSPLMSETTVPVLAKEGPSGVLVYTTGLALAVILTATSFWVTNTSTLWAPGVGLGLAVLAIAQMGVHLVFFLHI